jgi:hypothetical protein
MLARLYSYRAPNAIRRPHGPLAYENCGSNIQC